MSETKLTPLQNRRWKSVYDNPANILRLNEIGFLRGNKSIRNIVIEYVAFDRAFTDLIIAICSLKTWGRQVSTGRLKSDLRVEVSGNLVKQLERFTSADDYSYALAA